MGHSDKLLASAVGYHQSGRADEAEKAYRKLLRVDPVNGDGLRLLGGLYMQTNRWAEAVDYLEKAARIRPKDPETLTNLGIALATTGRMQEAQAHYARALELSPGSRMILVNLANLYQDTGHVAQALDIFEQVLSEEPDNPAAHYNCGNALLKAGRASEAATRYEQALKLKPDYLEAMVNLGMIFGQMGQADRSRHWLDQARGWFERALANDPNNHVALNNLGNILRQQGKADEAVACYEKALRLQPDYAEAALNRALAQRDLDRLDDAIASCRLAISLKPQAADAYNNLGTLLQQAGRHEEALAQFIETLKRKPDSIDAQWNAALSLLTLGQYEQGLRLHEAGLGVAQLRGETFLPERRWRGEDIAGKRLLIWCEQGLGDSLQFIRYAALCKARGAAVIVLCPRSLRKLFGNCGFIDALPERVDEKDFDVHTPLVSLPFIFGTRLETIPADVPYLRISDETRRKWAPKFARAPAGFKIGLVWSGNPRPDQLNANLIDRRRSMKLEALQPLFAVPGVQFYTLQLGEAAAQIDACGLRDRFVDLMSEVKDFEDTGAIIEQLDLVISVDTSVAHLAGGLGKPVWILSRFDACWRWLQNRPDSPWYPTGRVFGQTVAGDWDEVVTRVAAALEPDFLSLKRTC